MITILDYGLGNLRSVQKAFERIGTKVTVSNDINVIKKSDKLILPGVGNFAVGMKNLMKNNCIDILNEQVIGRKKPILGICLGMQLMTTQSEEGDCAGLNWINAKTKKFYFSSTTKNSSLRIPHMGWNTTIQLKDCSLLSNLSNSDFYYFVHSYYVECNDMSDVLLSTDYGINFHSAFNKENIFGVQFHPEKSHSAGLKLIKNFVNI